MNALIGHTGFVGSNILRQLDFNYCYNSNNIADIRHRSFDLVVCSGLRSMKWFVNKSPLEDLGSIDILMDNLSTITAKQFVLVSTIDVYNQTSNVDEDTIIDIGKCDHYGKHRLLFETFACDLFSTYILRLPTLFGNNLRKNAIYDLLVKKYSFLPNEDSSFQYYSLDYIGQDITRCLENNIRLLNVCSEPTSFSEVLRLFKVPHSKHGATRIENMVSKHSHIWGSKTKYLYTKNHMLAKLTKFISEYRIQTMA